ncbi:MAG: TolC family protein [Deltaproteobacteria bacterium]|nr:TolC family protein [Deltaproteobacteria bacterium]
MKRLCLIILTGLFFTANTWAVNLKDLQQAAVENRDVVRRYEAAFDQAAERIKEAKGNFLPSVDLSYTANRLDEDNDTTYEAKSNDWARIGASWNVFAGFADRYNVKSAEVLQESHRFQLAGIKQDICYGVSLGLLSVYRNQAYQQVTEDALNLYRDRYREVTLKRRVGVLKKSDQLKIKVEMDNALQDARRAKAQLTASFNDLSRETGLDLNQEALDFSCFRELPGEKAYAEYEALLFDRRSDLKAMEMIRRAAVFQAKASRAAYLPRVDMDLSYGHRDGDDYFFASPNETYDEVRCQATISMNLFDGMKKKARVSQSRLEEKKVAADMRELRADLGVRLKNTLLDLKVAFDNLDVARGSETEARENLRITDLAFKQGLTLSSDLLDAIYYLSRARFNVIDAHRQVFGSYFQLLRLIEGFGIESVYLEK